MERRLAVIGAGPIGLEVALEAAHRGHAVTLYERGRVGEHFLRYGPVRLFTPFAMNSTERGRARLDAEGVGLPAEDSILTAEAYRKRYLLPLARLPELRGLVREEERVLGVGREGFRKPHAVAAAGGRGRAGRPFLLRVGTAAGIRFDRAEVVVDASGVYATPNATGPAGLPAAGEEALGDRVEYHLPAIAARDRDGTLGARILLLGDGRSAATALVDLAAVVSRGGAGAGLRVDWVHRDRGADRFAPLPPETLDMLPELKALHERALAVAREAPWIRRHPGATVLAYASGAGAIRATLLERDGSETTVDVDRVIALVGYRPDLELCRELQVHLCYASEGPMALSAAILAAQAADPAVGNDCLAQASHGPASLQSPEPDFYVLGAKSYGRNPNFLLAVGHAQVRDALELIGGGAPAALASP